MSSEHLNVSERASNSRHCDRFLVLLPSLVCAKNNRTSTPPQNSARAFAISRESGRCLA